MAQYEQIQNNPLIIDLTQAARTRGWSIVGDLATHDACNAGSLGLLGYPLTVGVSYEYTYTINTCSSGYVETFLGTAHGAQFTAPTFVHETVVANGEDLTIFATGNSSVSNFAIRIVREITDQKAQNTISFSEKTKKWVSFYTYIPENAFSMFTKIYSFLNGNAYVHEAGTDERNEFYGVQYQSIINFVDNVAPALPKTFQAISLQVNELMVTTTDGIVTSLGQVSELASIDFLKDFLQDGVSGVNVYSIESVYAANFLRDKNSQGGLLQGDALRGNFLLCELISTESIPLLLYTINVVSKASPIGSR